MWSIKAAARARAIAPILACAALGACASGADIPDKHPLTPTQQFKISVEETPDRLAITPHADGLSSAQRVALIGFVSRWREATSAGDIAVQVPDPGDKAANERTASETMNALQALGVPSQQVRIGDYTAPAGQERILASYSSLQAKGPDCSRHWGNVTATASNRASDHFGCATTANLAALIADPRDLVAPALSTPADAARREVVLGKYRTGEITSTARDDQAAGAISSAVK